MTEEHEGYISRADFMKPILEKMHEQQEGWAGPTTAPKKEEEDDA